MYTRGLYLLIFFCGLCSSSPQGQVLQGRRITADGNETRLPIVAHPLTWWTRNPLRLDTSGILELGSRGLKGRPLRAADYRVEQKIFHVGVVAGRTILQIQTSIRPGPQMIAAGFPSDDSSIGAWKDLLVSSGNSGLYVEVYGLQMDIGGMFQETRAHVFGQGPEAILGTFDPDTGNGGGCTEGYWWFDRRGPHEVDFSPLLAAVQQAIPKDAVFTRGCWALHPEKSQLQSWVRTKNAECHACGGLGDVTATYRIGQGVAKPVSVTFKPETQ